MPQFYESPQTFSVVSGTGSGTRTLQVAGALCRVLDDWWIIQGMLASSSKRLAPYILGPSNATNGNYYSCFGPKWTKAFHVLIQLCSEYVAFWNTGSSATSDAAVAAALDEAIGYLEGTVGVPLVMPVRTSYSVDTPLTQKNDFPMPLRWSADKAARHIAARLHKRPYEIAFPGPFIAILWLLAHLPKRLQVAIGTRMARPSAKDSV